MYNCSIPSFGQYVQDEFCSVHRNCQKSSTVQATCVLLFDKDVSGIDYLLVLWSGKRHVALVLCTPR
jgi:hypothetical protein